MMMPNNQEALIAALFRQVSQKDEHQHKIQTKAVSMVPHVTTSPGDESKMVHSYTTAHNDKVCIQWRSCGTENDNSPIRVKCLCWRSNQSDFDNTNSTDVVSMTNHKQSSSNKNSSSTNQSVLFCFPSSKLRHITADPELPLITAKGWLRRH